jgi:serine/threonine protein kinase/tetratricopeptide (TPR) repeat protein
LIGKAISHYKILKKLGEGGMGTVYLAEDFNLGRTVAIKFLAGDVASDTALLARFRREAKSAARLKHPNIVTVHEFGEHEGTPYLVMEHVEGRTLADMLKAGPLPVTTAVNIAIQLCDGLGAAHEAGITHRDIKPGNVVIDTHGRARILDFGLAKMHGATVLTEDDTTVGTFAYMSPEQASGRSVDTRSDLFSLGAVVYEMLTDRRPFDADHPAAVTYKIIHEAQSALPSDLEQFNSVISRAMAKDPASRFQTAVEFGNALRAVSGQSVPEATKERRRWRPLITVAVSLVVAIAGALITINLFKNKITLPDTAVAGKRLAVMYFDNLTDPRDSNRYGEMLTELLITGLSESEELSIISSQRLYDLLKQLGKEGERKIDRTTATEIAVRAQARWMMQGRILQTEPSFAVTSQIVDVATGDVVASQRTEGRQGESLFSLVDRIIAQALNDLDVPDTAASGIPVAEISTASEDAYRHYLEGIEFSRKHFDEEARESFRRALAIDSTFAMAAFQLGRETEGVERRQLLQQAVRHADQASARERIYLKAAEALAEYDWPTVAAVLKEVLQKYPDDKFALEVLAGTSDDVDERIEYGLRLTRLDATNAEAWNALAYAFMKRGDAETALQAVENYIALEPDEPNPYDTQGDIYARFGRLDEAMASYQKAVEINPSHGDYGSVRKLGLMHAYEGDFEQAEFEYRRVRKSSDAVVRSWGRDCEIELLAYRGRYAEALEAFEAGEKIKRLEGVTYLGPEAIWRLSIKARLLKYADKEGAKTTEIVDQVKRWQPKTFWECYHACRTMLELGRVEEADRYIEALRSNMDNFGADEKMRFDIVAARSAFARGNYEDAIVAYDSVSSRAGWRVRGFWGQFVEACYKSGRWEDVARVGEQALKIYPVRRIRDARIHYYLGVAYQEIGRNDEAIGQFEKLLLIWEDADPGLEGLDHAGERLARLKQGG